ncbi:sulfotransferase family protein [Halobacillus sp. SY10]|uniref:sulfotransferase family protein n=1 Tax=Halobacillus sp. SY10 TaxID=3381356 RepID=UPI0038797F74
MNEEPIFLLGAHKSGTSLVRSLLEGHTDLFVVPIEAHFFEHLGMWIDYKIRRKYPESFSQKQIIDNFSFWIKSSNSEYTEFSDSDTRGYWNLDIFTNTLKNSLNSKTVLNEKSYIDSYVHAMYKSLYMEDLPHDKRVVEKSVENAEFAIYLKKLYPKAKFIHIIRNPYSNIVSIRKFKEQQRGEYPVLKHIVGSLYNSYYYLMKNQRIIDQRDYLTITYEELVSNPNIEIKKISKFLNIENQDILYKPSTINGSDWKGNSTSSEKFDGITNDRINKWKGEINPLEVNVINKLFPFILKEFNYESFYKDIGLRPVKGETLKTFFGNRIYFHGFL